MPARKGQKPTRRAEERRAREDAQERYGPIEREVNALRLDLQGRPEDEIRSLLEARYGGEIDRHHLEDCVTAIATGNEVSLTPDPSRPAGRTARRSG